MPVLFSIVLPDEVQKLSWWSWHTAVLSNWYLLQLSRTWILLGLFVCRAVDVAAWCRLWGANLTSSSPISIYFCIKQAAAWWNCEVWFYFEILIPINIIYKSNKNLETHYIYLTLGIQVASYLGDNWLLLPLGWICAISFPPITPHFHSQNSSSQFHREAIRSIGCTPSAASPLPCNWGQSFLFLHNQNSFILWLPFSLTKSSPM